MKIIQVYLVINVICNLFQLLYSSEIDLSRYNKMCNLQCGISEQLGYEIVGRCENENQFMSNQVNQDSFSMLPDICPPEYVCICFYLYGQHHLVANEYEEDDENEILRL